MKRDPREEAREDRIARIRAIVGKYADIPFSSEDLVRMKQGELEQEERFWKDWANRREQEPE